MTQSTIEDHDETVFRAYYKDRQEFDRYHKTIESYCRIHRKKIKTVKHYLESGELLLEHVF